MDLLLLSYNNYFNRKLIKENSFEAYEAKASNWSLVQEVNFKPADSVNTTQVINMDLGWTPDYLVTSDMTRWFVLEANMLRKGQYELSLRRDVLADFGYAYEDAPALIERGPLQPSSAFIYNKENFTFNQVKQSETLIKDETGTAWIVGYVSTDTDFDDYMESPAEGDETIPTFSDLGLVLNDATNPLLGAKAKAVEKCEITGRSWQWGNIFSPIGISKSSYDGSYGSYGFEHLTTVDPGNYANFSTGNVTSQLVENIARQMMSSFHGRKLQMLEALEDYAGTSATQQEVLALQPGVKAYDPTTGKTYVIKTVNTTHHSYAEKDIRVGDNAKLYYELSYNLKAVADALSGVTYLDGRAIAMKLNTLEAIVTLEENTESGQRRTKFSGTRQRLLDAPYDMFCMPFDVKNMALAQSFVTTAVEGKTKKIYDLQILPYCPNRQYAKYGLSGMTENVDYTPIEEYDGSAWKTVGYLLWNSKSSNTFFSDLTLSMPDFGLDVNLAEQEKLANECCSWRLTSPNYNGTWEFNVAKNGGSVNGFRIDFTYRPYSPYIHVAPLFDGLYGNVNDDARGLICNGDFSIDTVSDAWTEYQINNKNYQNIFDTQIKTMDANRQLDVLSQGVGTVLGAAGTGIGAGVLFGNPIVGAAAGAATLAGGVADMAISNQKYQNSRQQALDMHTFQLGNVKALPDTLTKVSSYNVNNKYFPFVEEYRCTTEEAEAFLAFLRERNYSIGVVSTISKTLESRTKDGEFVKAKVYRMPLLKDDPHLASALAEELETGVYM